MTELILYWWLIPAMVVLICFRLMIWHDDMSLDDINWWSMAIMVGLSIVWPIGVAVMMVIIAESYMKRWGWIR